MDGGESFSPWQPITNDPTPRKGWRDERMDGDNGGGVGRSGGERRKEQETKRKYKTGEEDILLGDAEFKQTTRTKNRQQWCLIYKWRTVKEQNGERTEG